jgi:hypothetical protein
LATNSASRSTAPTLAAPPGEPSGSSPSVKKAALAAVNSFHWAGDVVVVEDGLDRADGLAGAAVHALVGVDVEHAVAFVDAVDRAFLDAGLVLDVDAGLADDVGHCQPPSLADSLRASVDLVAPPRIPCYHHYPAPSRRRSGQARASGSTASYAWCSCACDIRLADLHDVRSGGARGMRASASAPVRQITSGTVH